MRRCRQNCSRLGCFGGAGGGGTRACSGESSNPKDLCHLQTLYHMGTILSTGDPGAHKPGKLVDVRICNVHEYDVRIWANMSESSRHGCSPVAMRPCLSSVARRRLKFSTLPSAPAHGAAGSAFSVCTEALKASAGPETQTTIPNPPTPAKALRPAGSQKPTGACAAHDSSEGAWKASCSEPV